MNDELNTLLEIKQVDELTVQQGSRVTLLARFCQVFGWLCLALGLFSCVPGGPSTGGYFNFPVYPLISFFGLLICAPLTLLLGIAALLRIRFSSKNFKGVKQVLVSIGLGTLVVAMFFIRINNGSW